MSPADINIVPMEPQPYDDRYMEETCVDVIGNHVYSMEDPAANYASGSSVKPLIRQQPQSGRQVPQIGKQAQVREGGRGWGQSDKGGGGGSGRSEWNVS